MGYKRKYRQGKQITSLDELVKQDFVYMNGKITHRGWVQGWQVGYVMRCIKNGWLYYAVKVSETKEGAE